MSDTLIEFAKPELLRDGDSAAQWRYDLMLASIVWNGVLVGKTAAELLASLCEEGPLDPELALIVATGDGGYRFHRDHRDPGARPVAPAWSSALTVAA